MRWAICQPHPPPGLVHEIRGSAVTVSFEATTGRVGSAAVPEVNTEARLTVNAIDFRVSAAQ